MTLRVRAKEPIVVSQGEGQHTIVLAGTPGTVYYAGHAEGLGGLRITVRWDAAIMVDGVHSEVADDIVLPGVAAMQLEYVDVLTYHLDEA